MYHGKDGRCPDDSISTWFYFIFKNLQQLLFVFLKLKFYWHKSLSDASWGTLKFIKRKEPCQRKRISIIQLSSHFSHLWFQPLISRWLYFICSSPCLFFWSWSSIDIKVCQMHLEKHWSLSRGRNPVRAKELDQLFNWIHTLGTLCIFLFVYVIGYKWTLHAIVKRLSCFFDGNIIDLQL